MAEDANKKAADELAEEAGKLGFSSRGIESDEDDSQDMGDLEDDNEEEESSEDVEDKEDDTSEDTDEEDDEESDDADDSDEEDEDEEDENDEDEESDKDSSKKKKVIPFKVHNKLRKELREAKKKLADSLEDNKKLADKLPDDFQEKLEELTKKLGVEDPESLKEIVKFLKEYAVDKNADKLQEQIADLKKEVADAKSSTPIVDEFPAEWKTFSEEFFSKEFPNATKEQKKEARKIMYELSHSKKTGGKVYKDEKSGKDVLDPYPLDYIYFKNKEEFASLVTKKKNKGMERTRTQGFRDQESGDDKEVKPLSKNASGADILALDKKYSRLEAGVSDELRSPDNSNI